MNQFNLYGTFVKQFTEMALPEASEAMYHYARMTTQRIVANACLAPQDLFILIFQFASHLSLISH